MGTGQRVTLQSGTPFSVVTNDTDFVQARADYVAGCNPVRSGSVESRLTEYFNTACFSSATAARDFGNAGRNILRGPNQQNVDISVIKYFPITERTKLEFRSEFFNAFNKVSFANPLNIVASPCSCGTDRSDQHGAAGDSVCAEGEFLERGSAEAGDAIL